MFYVSIVFPFTYLPAPPPSSHEHTDTKPTNTPSQPIHQAAHTTKQQGRHHQQPIHPAGTTAVTPPAGTDTTAAGTPSSHEYTQHHHTTPHKYPFI